MSHEVGRVVPTTMSDPPNQCQFNPWEQLDSTWHFKVENLGQENLNVDLGGWDFRHPVSFIHDISPPMKALLSGWVSHFRGGSRNWFAQQLFLSQLQQLERLANENRLLFFYKTELSFTKLKFLLQKQASWGNRPSLKHWGRAGQDAQKGNLRKAKNYSPAS